jgi:hypothetical protein
MNSLEIDLQSVGRRRSRTLCSRITDQWTVRGNRASRNRVSHRTILGTGRAL